MEKHPIENIMSTTMENLNSMIDVDKVIGNAVIAPDGSTVIPVSQVSFGFVSGGGEYEMDQSKKEDFPFLGASGAGVSVKPNGFLVISGESIRFLPIQKNTSYDKLIDLVPLVMEQIKKLKQEEDTAV
ncbi:MAG: GerW family sporulation protein [Clostridia bacterium]|jgi:sporulation protein YtfJ|nr:GerW family sporulation protein [Clostridia bacterium]